MKIQVKSSIESKVSLTDLTYLDSSLHNDLGRDHYLTQQYIEATQIIIDLRDHLADVEDASHDDAVYSSHSTIESHHSNNELIQHFHSVSATDTDDDSPVADLCILINDLTEQLRAQLDGYSVNQRSITGSTDSFSTVIDTMSKGGDEIDQLLIPVKFDDRDE